MVNIWRRANHHEEIWKSIKRRKWNRIGHTLRIKKTGGRHNKDIALEWNSQCYRKRGSSKTSWRRTVHDELAEQGTTWLKIKNIGKDRKRLKIS